MQPLKALRPKSAAATKPCHPTPLRLRHVAGARIAVVPLTISPCISPPIATWQERIAHRQQQEKMKKLMQSIANEKEEVRAHLLSPSLPPSPTFPSPSLTFSHLLSDHRRAPFSHLSLAFSHLSLAHVPLAHPRASR